MSADGITFHEIIQRSSFDKVTQRTRPLCTSFAIENRHQEFIGTKHAINQTCHPFRQTPLVEYISLVRFFYEGASLRTAVETCVRLVNNLKLATALS